MSAQFLAVAVAALGLIFGCDLHGQSYSPMYQPVTGNTQYWTCINIYTGEPIPGASWDVYTHGYWAGTNDHLHYGSIAPVSVESPSSGTADGSGNFSFALISTLVSQAEFYDLACSAPGYSGGSAEAEYAVGYSDVYWVSQPSILYQTGGNTTNHGDNTGNHWMMSTPAYGIYYTSTAYVSLYNPGALVCDNDMALPFAGKFDIQDNWTSPHSSHDRGSAVDIAVTSSQCPSAYVVTNPSAFLSLCISNGAVAGGVSYAGTNDIHCNWLNPSTYPH